jgi:hypothetical protein
VPAGSYALKLFDVSGFSYTVPFTITSQVAFAIQTGNLPSATTGQYYPPVTLLTNEGNMNWSATQISN